MPRFSRTPLPILFTGEREGPSCILGREAGEPGSEIAPAHLGERLSSCFPHLRLPPDHADSYLVTRDRCTLMSQQAW